MILVVSTQGDGHAQEVLTRLKRRKADAFLLNLSAYPTEASLTIGFPPGPGAGEKVLSLRDARVDLSTCRVAWWRRPQPFRLHPEVQGPHESAFAYTEVYCAFAGLWLTLDALWINHPTRDEEASRKVHQLNVAKDLGFRIPDTCITNDLDRARDFIDTLGPNRTIYKAFSGTEEAWRETRILKPEELALLDSVRFAPVIFQEYVPAEVDLRITMVGDRIFPAAIHSQETDYPVDFRMDMDSARVEAVTLPREVEDRLLEFMRRMGLVYGAIDMRLTPAGDYVFLEINPSGQWLFVEHRTNQPITEALIDLMIEGDRVQPPAHAPQ
jgi:glutathione synthase/RimK-type ligase-like ATP-grasp enzyme